LDNFIVERVETNSTWNTQKKMFFSDEDLTNILTFFVNL